MHHQISSDRLPIFSPTQAASMCPHPEDKMEEHTTQSTSGPRNLVITHRSQEPTLQLPTNQLASRQWSPHPHRAAKPNPPPIPKPHTEKRPPVPLVPCRTPARREITGRSSRRNAPRPPPRKAQTSRPNQLDIPLHDTNVGHGITRLRNGNGFRPYACTLSRYEVSPINRSHDDP
jgi:hypothetical protein